MLIRDRYVSVIDRMASRFGRESGDHVILRDATLSRCIDYAARYLYEGDTIEHYRYKRYMRALEDLVRDYGGRRKTSTIVHVDVGCGPGLFSWVVHDYFRDREPEIAIELYAYDQSPAMVGLADLIWREFETGVHLGATSDLDELISQVMQGGPPADVIVSFGHVLVQTSDQEDTIDNFADILSCIRLDSNLIVAVDAQKDPAIQRFHRSIDRLVETLATHGVELRPKFQGRGSMVAVVAGYRSGEANPTSGGSQSTDR